jgi:hypothetical protein
VSEHDQLTRELRDRAEQVGGHPVSLEAVRRRASRIRWQRRGAAVATGLAVVAVLVPAGILAGRTLDSPPAVNAPSPTQTPHPTGRAFVTLTADVARGESPATAFFAEGGIHAPASGISFRTDQELSYLASYDGGWVGSEVDESGAWTTFRYDALGEVVGSYASTGQVAVSADRSLAAFSTPDGQVMVLRSTEPSPVGLRTEGTGTYTPVSVNGSDGQCVDPEGAAGSDCEVFYTDGATPRSYATHAHGNVETLPVRKLAGISPEGWLAGTVSATDTGSCSAVFDDRWVERWRTCDYTLGRFSADGRYVLGHPAYRDGIGDGMLAILDARTGEVLVDARPEPDVYAFVHDAVWQPDGTVLATVWDTDGWALLRLTPDGHLTRALAGRLAGEPEDAPVALAATP